jgi:DNA-binding CsgD family transcriptional regulator
MGMPAEDDAEAILQLLETETRAFWEKDFNTFAECWVQEPYIRRSGWWSLGGVTYREGWEEFATRYREQIARNPRPNVSAHRVRRDNVNLRVGKDMAWLTFDQYAPNTGEKEMDMPGLSRETRIAEKHGGRWKFAYMGYLHRSTHHIDSAFLRVTGHGAVTECNEAAEAAIRTGCGLEIVEGRLRAPDRAANRRLKSVLGWAARLDRGFDSLGGVVPVVLEGADDGVANICWVAADSGLILVLINDRELAENRLETAALIFDFTPAQIRVAKALIAGVDRQGAADALNVSINTVRTHLQRMFEKTGVHSQQALVRILLSAAQPPAQA